MLKPIHNAIFNLLKDVECDGTFDQLKPVRNVLNRFKLRSDITYYSFDLSAATDRLPVKLQGDILNSFIPELGTLWANLLVNMDYTYVTPHKKEREIRYAVGQPMGAYSS